MILKSIDIDTYSEKAEGFLGVFSSRKWLSVYDEQLQFVGIYKDERQLIGGFYFIKTKKFNFSFIKLPPYTPHCGLFFQTESSNRSSLHNFSKDVITAVCNEIEAQKAALTILAFPSAVADLQPFIWSKFKVVPNYTYRIDLSKPIEQIKSNFDPKNRNVINKAIREEVTTTENVLGKEQLYDFFISTLSSAGANIYKKELKGIFTKFSDETNSFSIEARRGAELLGVVFCVFDKINCYYLLGGVNKNSKINGVNNLLVLKCIEKAIEKGCAVFDFEGSMLKGVEKFFRSFGPELVPYYTVNKAILPIEILLKFKKRELF